MEAFVTSFADRIEVSKGISPDVMRKGSRALPAQDREPGFLGGAPLQDGPVTLRHPVITLLILVAHTYQTSFLQLARAPSHDGATYKTSVDYSISLASMHRVLHGKVLKIHSTAHITHMPEVRKQLTTKVKSCQLG